MTVAQYIHQADCCRDLAVAAKDKGERRFWLSVAARFDELAFWVEEQELEAQGFVFDHLQTNREFFDVRRWPQGPER
jgi:hypothetical protein